jgi:DNA ligase-1
MTTKTFADAILEAEQHSKQAPKFAALAGMAGDDLKLVVEALNPYRVFNVKKFDWPQAFANTDDTYARFFDLLNQLHDRTLSGNAARAAIPAVLGCFTERTAKVLARVLLKDLKCGATSSTFEKIYPGLSIPKFELMGAEKMDAKYKWIFPCIGEAKYDGTRLIAIIKSDATSVAAKPQGVLFDDDTTPTSTRSVTYWSRGGRQVEQFAGIFDAELIKMADELGRDIIVDGEALASSFQETVKAKGSENAEAKANLKFYAFDIMDLTHWEAQSCPVKQQDRSTGLEALIKKLNLTKILKSKYKILKDMTEAKDFYEEVLKDGLNPDGTTNGLGEGLIIKYLDGLYQWNMGGSRGPEWTKWKPIIDVDLRIVGFYEGDPGTKNEGKLGGLKLEGTDENGNEIKTNCGGFKVAHPKMKPLLAELAKKAGVQFDDPKKPNYVKNKDQFLREYIWDHQDEFLGKIAMLEAQELSLAEGATHYALRFPQFVTIRDDKE